MKKFIDRIVTDMTAEEEAALYVVTPIAYDVQTSALAALKMLLNGTNPATDDDKITVCALYNTWTSGSHTKGEVYTAAEQVWECYQDYDNAVYPDIVPGNAAWYTFNRPLHGTTPQTARYFVQPTGAHDMYRAGEYAVFDDRLCKCKSDTAYLPAEYPATWETA